MLENAAAIRLKQHYGEEVYYLKSAVTGIDVDFYILSERAAIQVCSQLNDQSADREISSLEKAAAAMPELNRLIIVTGEGAPSGFPGHPRIELIPTDLFLLKGIGAV